MSKFPPAPDVAVPKRPPNGKDKDDEVPGEKTHLRLNTCIIHSIDWDYYIISVR